jgi:translocator protein
MRYLLLITSLLVIGFTSLVSIPGSPYLIGDRTQADISDMYPTALTPAGFTFSIWSVIYLSWIIAGVYVAFFSKEKNISRKVFKSFSLAIGLTALWLIPWGMNMIGLALIIMIAILAVLKYSYRISRSEHPFVRWSIELTLGWIHIATVANVTIWLVYSGFDGGNISEIYWAISVIGLAWFLTLYYQMRY